MKLSINKNIINKNDTKANQAKGFESLDLTVNELAECINQGFAFSYQFHSNYRNTSNFICSDIIAADIDDGMTIEEALADDFITKNASIIYTTPSHTTEKPRFRIVFQLPHTVTDKDLIKFAQTGLTRKFPAVLASTSIGARVLHICGCRVDLELRCRQQFECVSPVCGGQQVRRMHRLNRAHS